MKSTRFILVFSILTFTVIHKQLVAAGNANLTNNVFHNVVVAIATIDTYEDSDSINSFIDTLKSLLQMTSNTTYTATGDRLSFGSITILLPANWQNWNKTQTIRNEQSSNIPNNLPSFDTADIRIDITNNAYDFMPYTQQSGFCGERGDFIHITYKFIMGRYDILKYGTPSKLLAREWIKYYFGVFDEQGYNFDYMYPVKYFAPGATPILNLCNSTCISWSSYSCDDESQVQGLPASCDLRVNIYETTDTSMMSLPLLPIASEFCSKENHNSYAPNKQNIMCDGKSIMEIILQNSGVKNSGTFMFADASITIDQLTFDNALAMAIFWDNMDYDTTSYSALPSLSKFIQYDFPSNAYISLQESVEGILTQPWTQIISQDDRSKVVNTIAKVSTHDTENRFEAFDNLLESAKNMSDNIKVLLFVSAGDISWDDWTQFCESAVQNNFQFRLISYSSLSVENFMSNSNCIGEAILIQVPICQNWIESCCQIQECCRYLQEKKLFDEFIRAVPNTVAPNLYGPPQTFCEELLFDSIDDQKFNLPSQIIAESLTIRFYYETCENFYVSSSSKPYCTLNDCNPHQCNLDSNATQTYCASQPICSEFTPVYFSCVNPTQLPYIVYVVGQPSNSISDPQAQNINLYAWTMSDHKSPYAKVRIFARLVKGTTPVFQANVQATIVTTYSSYSATITLRDDGSGNPDISKEDGIYSAYITQFTWYPVYTVTVMATEQYDEHDQSDIITSYPNSSYPWISGDQSMKLISTEPFTRVVSAGSFYIDLDKTGIHGIPPGRIMDLQVSYSDSHEVDLQWTTPGEDLDYGRLEGFYLNCGTNRMRFDEPDFEPSESLFHSSSQSAGSISHYTISGDVDDQTHYCVIMTCDSEHNCSAPSNIVTYSIVWPASRRHNIMLWTSMAIVIVILLALAIVIIALYRKEIKTANNLVRQTTPPVDGDDINSLPMDCLPNELQDVSNSQRVNQNQFLDLPPSYEDATINQPPTIIDQSTNVTDNTLS